MSPFRFVRLGLRACVAALFALSFATSASAQTYHEGFEADPDTWFGTDRVASGTNGVVSSEGAFHAVAALAAAPDNLTFSRLGGYNAAFPSHGFDVSVDIWLDVAATFANDAQMDYTVAVNNPQNTHRRDFVFNVGFYDATDLTGPAGGTDRYVMSASNNAGGGNADPKNPARNPIAITTTGWYTFKHEFRRIAGDVLSVRLAVYDDQGTELGTWTLSDASDVIGVTVGGNRYAWFATNEWGSSLLFDESKKQNAPQPDFTGYFVDVSEWSSFTAANPAAGIYPVGGSGQANGNFVVKQKDGVQIGIRASKRSAVPNTWPTYRDSAIGVYLADPGFDQVANRPDRAAWNYDIHADLRNAAGAYEGKTLDDFDLILDTDIGNPLFGSPVPIKVDEDFPVGGPGAALLQTSQNPLFGQDPSTPFDYNLEKDYFLKLSLVPTTFVGATIEIEIRVDVTPEKGGLPSVDPIGIKSVEPHDGFNRVTLYTIVQDPDSDPLTVEWKVDGVVEQTETDVLTDSTSEFTFDFPLGSSSVEVEVSDADNTVSASTTITVSDTVGPVVVVAPDVVVETDPGEDFATGVVLSEPTVVDAFDGDPTLINDAPLVFPLGETTVTWTATDASGNATTGTQKVTVEDREAPRIGSTPRVVANVDAGEVFATIDLDEPNGTDNVDDPVALTNDAPTTFPVGKTQVNWTATDAAGNVSVRTQVVLVKNAKPVADAGPVIRVKASAKSGARVRLDGSASSDADEQDLTFEWSAKGINFGDASSAAPSAKFPVGKTIVTLVVTDPVGVKSTDQVAVVVSFDKSAVIDGRPFGKIVRPYVDASVSTLTAYAEQNPSSSALGYAASFAEYAKAYDTAARSVRYNEGNLESQTEVYLTYRYYQVYFSANAATYAYMGSGASDGYYYAAAAQYYGQADLDY